MNHRIVSTVVVIIVSLFVVAALLFTWAAATIAPPGVGAASAPDDPHPPARRTARCTDCHTVELETIPVTHRTFRVGSCASCHRPAIRVLVPHTALMGEKRCPLCHGDPAREHGMPAAHLRYRTDVCLLCHPVDPGRYYVEPAAAGLALSPANPIPHETEGIFEDCAYCHSIEPGRSLPENHRDFALETCEDCHESSKQDE